MKKYFILLLTIFVLFPLNAIAADESSLIAVAADDKELSGLVSDAAARCRYFLLFDEQGELKETIENPYRTAAGGSGRQAAEFLAVRNVKMVIAGEFGRNMLSTLREKGLTALEFKGSAAEAVKLALEK